MKLFSQVSDVAHVPLVFGILLMAVVQWVRAFATDLSR